MENNPTIKLEEEVKAEATNAEATDTASTEKNNTTSTVSVKRNSKKNTTRNLTIAGLSAALITVFTLVQIPTGISQGYINLGDLAIVACAFMLPEYWMYAAAAGIGSALADIISGFAMYAPGTFVIKAALGLLAVLAVRKLSGKRILQMLMFLAISLVVPAGYFLYECQLYDFSAALSAVLFNFAQAAIGTFVGGILGNIVFKLIRDSKA